MTLKNLTKGQATALALLRMWRVGRVTRANAGGVLYNAVRIDNDTEHCSEPTHSLSLAQMRVDQLNAHARVQAREVQS